MTTASTWRTHRCPYLVLILLSATGIGPALAQPPQMPLPSEAGSETELLSQFWGWANYGLEIMLILIGAAIFVMVAWFVVAKFLEIGRTQGSFAMAIPTLLVGLFVLAIGGILLTIAWNVLQNTTLSA